MWCIIVLPCASRVRCLPGAHGWSWLAGRVLIRRRFWGHLSPCPSQQWSLPRGCLSFLCEWGSYFDKYPKLVKMCSLHFVVVCCGPSDPKIFFFYDMSVFSAYRHLHEDRIHLWRHSAKLHQHWLTEATTWVWGVPIGCWRCSSLSSECSHLSTVFFFLAISPELHFCLHMIPLDEHIQKRKTLCHSAFTQWPKKEGLEREREHVDSFRYSHICFYTFPNSFNPIKTSD